MPCAGSSHFSVFIKPVLIVQAALRLKALIYDTSHNALPALCAENKMLGLVPAIGYLCSRLRIWILRCGITLFISLIFYKHHILPRYNPLDVTVDLK